MCRVRPEETTAVRSELFDRFLRRYWSLGDDLFSALYSCNGGVCMQILNHALRHEQQAGDDRERKQNVNRGAGNVHPEIADGLFFLAGESSHQRDRNRNAGRRRGEVLNR